MKYLLFLLSLVLPGSARAAEPFELKDGDRVVFVGSTLIEREQRYGYWEAALTRRWPDRNITFRNLGWSGDTVWGDARASFDSRGRLQTTQRQRPRVQADGDYHWLWHERIF